MCPLLAETIFKVFFKKTHELEVTVLQWGINSHASDHQRWHCCAAEILHAVPVKEAAWEKSQMMMYFWERLLSKMTLLKTTHKNRPWTTIAPSI